VARRLDDMIERGDSVSEMIWKRVLAAIKEQRANHAWRRWKASGTARLAARVVPTDRVQYAAAVRRSRGSLWEAASSKWRDVRYMPGSERRTSMIRIAKSGAIVALTMIVAACGQEPAATEATALPDSITAAVEERADSIAGRSERLVDSLRAEGERRADSTRREASRVADSARGR